MEKNMDTGVVFGDGEVTVLGRIKWNGKTNFVILRVILKGSSINVNRSSVMCINLLKFWSRNFDR